MFLSYFLYLNALFAQSLFVYDAVMLALLQIFKLPFGSQISNLNWQDVPYYTSYGTILSTTKIKKNKYLCVGYVNVSTYSGGAVGASFSIDAAYSQTIPMVARNTGTGATTFVDASVSSSGMYAVLPSGYDEIRGSFVIPLA